MMSPTAWRHLEIVALGALALASLSACATERRLPCAPRPNEPTVRVMTYNVNFGLAGDPTAIAVLDEGWADLVVLQETTPAWERQLRSELQPTYPHMRFRHSGGAGGLAALSKVPFEERDYLPARAGWFPAWRLVFDTSLGPLQVLAVHLRPPVSDGGSVVSGYFTTPSIRAREIRDHFAALDPSLPTLVVGDFNEGAGGRALVFLRERGIQSALPQFDTPQDTWHWSTSIGSIEMQLDHIAHDERLEPLSVRVVPAGSSDHWPVAGVFALAPRAPGPSRPSGSSAERPY